jgi:hypothetical protein
VAHFWIRAGHSDQTAFAASQSQIAWVLDSKSMPHSEQRGFSTICLFQSFPLVGRISLQTRQRNNCTVLGIFSCQISFQLDLVLGVTEAHPFCRSKSSKSRLYALRTENNPFLVPAQTNLSFINRGLIGILQICSAVSSRKICSSKGMFHQLVSKLIKSLTLASGLIFYTFTWIMWVCVEGIHLSSRILIFEPSPIFHKMPSFNKGFASQYFSKHMKVVIPGKIPKNPQKDNIFPGKFFQLRIQETWLVSTPAWLEEHY